MLRGDYKEEPNCIPAQESQIAVCGFELPLTGTWKGMEESPRPEQGEWDQNQNSTWRSVLETALLLFICVTSISWIVEKISPNK